LEALNAFCKTGQTIPATLHGRRTQIPLSVQAIALANRFFVVLHAPQVPRFELADFQTKAVGAKVNGGEEGLGMHGGINDKDVKDYVTDI
jgi:hypothetical protein